MATIIEKVKKLLELANNEASTENEAYVAMLKAQELMAANGISEDSLVEKKAKIISICAVCDGVRPSCRGKAFRIPLALTICKNYRCECYMVGKEIHILGYEDDAKIAAECYKYAYAIVYNLGQKLVSQCYRDGVSAHGVHESYAQGFISGLKVALGKQSMALAIVVPGEVKQELEELTSRGKEKRYNAPNAFSHKAFQKGMDDGKQFFGKKGLEGAV